MKMSEQMKMTEQMAYLAGMRGLDARGTPEEAWISAHLHREADKEFRRMRRRAICRRIVRALSDRREIERVFSVPETEGGTGRLHVPIDSIVGTVDWAGRDVRFLPVMGRKLRAAWRHWFLSDDIDSYPAPNVRLGPGGWYLIGEPAALVVVEVLRAKGHRTLAVRPATARRGVNGEEERGCCGEEPKIAS
jgi:hypothetical protein